MNTSYLPEGYNSVSPYFILDDPEAFEVFLQKVFNGVTLRKYLNNEQKIVHAEMKVFGSVIMYSNATPKYPPNQLLVHVYLPDVDDSFKKAVDFGCEVVNAPVQHDGDPDKRGNFKDPWNNLWSVATQQGN